MIQILITDILITTSAMQLSECNRPIKMSHRILKAPRIRKERVNGRSKKTEKGPKVERQEEALYPLTQEDEENRVD